ncbi:hypothetical protein [Yimella sp. cx-51]|uniref:ArsA family ATPase n=1 Tax=Yimella sp. cx-51 TaxID=2770551 RepID=UPI00165D9FAA|nr:hypothetical protein [Yimella sp. cx-51]MBC9957606.1 hypothetical protein [Yimella sp. cx-51]MBD2758648.1 hypothetical protein [Yimella sp. cx-573]QTH37034.1 hypothetical protein J5M86_08880 [Yimella sp. cx-51]
MTARLLIVGGAGGAGSSTRAARMADSLAADGARVGVAALDPHFGADGMVTRPGCVQVRVEPRVPDEVAAAADAWRVDPIVTARLIDDMTQRGLPLLWRLPELVSEHDHLVLDLGSALGRALLAVHQLRWYLGELGPLHAGWLRATRPVTALAMGSSVIGKAGSRQLAAVVEHLDVVADLIGGSGSAVVLVHGAGERASAKARLHASATFLAQVRLGAVVADSVAPDDFLRAQLEGCGIPVWDELADGWVHRLADPGRGPSLTGDARDDEVISWRIPLPFNDFSEVDVEQSGRRLIVGVQGERRTFELPSSLQRHSASSASVRTGILEVLFDPIRPTQHRRSTT